MNDPGLDDTITDAATQAHSTVGALKDNENKLNKAQEEEDAASAMPTRWWYASTAFPLIAGTFGPMANAFSINALVENWRVEIPPGGTEEHGIDIKDPRWLIAINAVSLGFALLANLSLLLNMAKRVRFEIAQPITILGFWVASVLLIGLISYTSTTAFDPPNVPDHALTQAYYYAIFAAAMYQIISYLMCFTVWGAYKGAYSKDFELTVAQRTLMLQTISFLVYLQVGALIYSKVEKWKYLDSVYFMNFTLLTVGIGDYSPSTHTGRSLLFPIAVGGIITIGLVVSSLRTLLLERGSEKMSARVTEKTRRRVIKQVEAMARRGKPLKKPMFGLKDNTVKDLAQDPQQDHTDELERRKLEFEAMRTVQDLAAKEKQYLGLTLSVTAFAILWFVGAVVFWEAEKNQQWSYFASLYFSYTSILTIGYGDLYPMSNSGKPFFVLWSLLAVPTLTILISNMGDTVVKGVKDATIWLGEISVLPSSESRMRDRLTRGLNRGGLKSLKFVKAKDDEEDKTEDQDEADEEWSDMKQLHPGLIQIFSATDRSRVSPRDIKVLDRLAAAWSASEVEDEQAAQERQDDLAEAEHHYRHLLISQIPKLYGDTKAKTPRKYSYAEWTFYLRLIGEDEGDSTSHRRAKLHHNRAKAEKPRNRDNPDEKEPDATHNQDQGTTPRWSWIGVNSPLMQEQDEAEWILQRLFEKLEESLREQSHELEGARQDNFDLTSHKQDSVEKQ